MPFVTFTGVTENTAPLQTVVVIFVITGFGFTVTVTVKSLPKHVPEVGLTVYTTLIGELVEFVNVPEILEAEEPEVVPVIFVTIGATQV